MKAIILTEPGGVENLLLSEIETPQPKEGEVVIRAHAISINPVDIKTRKGGRLYATLAETAPVILGWDVSGVVTSVGEGASRFKEGDEVFGMINFPGHGRAYAEYVSAPQDHLALKPSNITHEEAAAATLAALTAWQALLQQANLKQGDRVLIHAAAGGVGHFAVQIAKHFGATVVGTASPANKDYLLQLGVDQFIDYTSSGLAEAGEVDIVLDPIGGQTTEASLPVLTSGGTLVSIVGGANEAVQKVAKEKYIVAKNYLVHSSGEDMAQLAAMLQQGNLKSTISHHYSLEQMPDAHRQIETGKTRGKVVVRLW